MQDSLSLKKFDSLSQELSGEYQELRYSNVAPMLTKEVLQGIKEIKGDESLAEIVNNLLLEALTSRQK